MKFKTLLTVVIFEIVLGSCYTIAVDTNVKSYRKCHIIKEDIRCKFEDAQNITCYTILSAELPFGCWGAPCSMQNEAYWLGSHAIYNGLHFFAKRNHSAQAVNFFWTKFIHMTDSNGSIIIDGSLEKLPIPSYAQILSKEMAGKYIVPQICDPKANLYCENSLDGYEYRNPSDMASFLPSSKCKCNPLYSYTMTRKTGSKEGQTNICLGRPNTPCGFELEDAFPDELGVLREMHPQYLRDDTFSSCMENTKCIKFQNEQERNSFREGKIWHGFGYNPITVVIILKSATRICKCNDGFVANKMYDCVPVS